MKKQELKIEYVDINSIKPYLNNAKEHPAEQIEQIKKSILEFGMNDPIGIWKDEVVEGHGRLIACKELDFEEVPIIRLDHLSDEQRRAYILAHNKLTMNSDFNIDILNEELDNIIDINMEDFGFEIENLIDNFTEDEEKQKDDSIKYFSNEEIQEDIVSGWKDYNSVDEFIDNIIDIPTAKYQFNRLCQGYNDGYNISLLFNKHRLTTPTIVSKDIYYGFNNDEKYRKSLARYIVNIQNKVVPQSQYYRFIGLGTGGYQYVNEFQPYLARDIYKKYVKNGDRVLNPCAGWGGRLIGLASCMFDDIEYVETDPSKETYKGLTQLKKFLNLGDNYKQYDLPFEELELEDDYFDFVFTSPPYFNTELYSEDEEQSYKNKDNYEDWRDNFLYVMIDKIMKCMKTTGKCLLNVGNKKYPIGDDIRRYLKTKYEVECHNLDYSLDNNAEDSVRTSNEDFILFGKV